jgi:hypothetical protein
MIVSRAVGEAYASEVEIVETADATVRVTVRTTLPLVGLLGAPRAMEVTARAPVESLE